jgi:ATP/maltotriose-dependent transcriptional regulator MalT
VTGLRFAALALKHRSDADAFLRGFSCDVRTVQGYLIEEVLAQQLPAAQACLSGRGSGLALQHITRVGEGLGSDTTLKELSVNGHFIGAMFHW